MAYIGFVVFLLILFILFCPVKVYVDYIDGKTKLTLKISPFFSKLIYDSESSKKVASKKEKVTQKKPNGETEPKKETKKKSSYLIMDIIHTILDIFPYFGKSIRLLLQGITISHCNIGVLLYEEDPEELGMKCGKMQGVIYSVYPILCHAVKLKHFKATVLPNFLGQQESNAVELEASTTLWKVLVGGIYFVIHGGIKLLKSPIMHKDNLQKKTKQKINSNNKIKDGSHYAKISQ